MKVDDARGGAVGIAIASEAGLANGIALRLGFVVAGLGNSAASETHFVDPDSFSA